MYFFFLYQVISQEKNEDATTSIERKTGHYTATSTSSFGNNEITIVPAAGGIASTSSRPSFRDRSDFRFRIWISDQMNSDFGSDSNPELLSPPKIPAFFKLDPDLSDLGGSNSDFSDFGSDLDGLLSLD